VIRTRPDAAEVR